VNAVVDIMGSIIGVLAALLYYETFFVVRYIKRYQRVAFISSAVLLSTTSTWLFRNTAILPFVALAIVFLLSMMYVSSIIKKVKHSLLVSAVIIAPELLVEIIFTHLLRITIDQVQGNATIYMVGVLLAGLFSLLLVCVIRLFLGKVIQETGRLFSVLMAFMPIQSIILCLIVYGYSGDIVILQTPALGVAAIVISLFLVFVFILVLDNQRKALAYKREYDVAKMSLQMQVEHTHKLYQTHQEVRLMHHDIRGKLLAVSGMLAKGSSEDAVSYIRKMESDVRKTSEVVDSGFPAIDAILDAKICKARESDIEIEHRILLNDDLMVDQLDLAMIISNALDNAIEGILRSVDVERHIVLHVTNASGYISLYAENQSDSQIHEGFRTSKADQQNHGFGIEQMKSIALKYSGDVQPDYNKEKGMFTLNIVLKDQKE